MIKHLLIFAANVNIILEIVLLYPLLTINYGGLFYYPQLTLPDTGNIFEILSNNATGHGDLSQYTNENINYKISGNN